MLQLLRRYERKIVLLVPKWLNGSMFSSKLRKDEREVKLEQWLIFDVIILILVTAHAIWIYYLFD